MPNLVPQRGESNPWVWSAVGAVGGSLLAYSLGADRWSAAACAGLFFVSVVVLIWLGSWQPEERPSASAIGLVAIARGFGLAITWAAVWFGIWPSLPAAGTELGKLARGAKRTAVAVGRVMQVPEARERGWVLQIRPHEFDGEPVDSGGWDIRVYLPGEPGAKDQASDRDKPPLPGDIVEAFVRLDGYPRASLPDVPAPRRRMARRGVAARGIIDGEIEVEPPGGLRWLGWSHRRLPADWRVAMLGQMVRELGNSRAAYPAAMVLGARGLLTDESQAAFESTGTAHLLAISGLHLGVLAAGLWWLLGAVVSRFPVLLRRWGRRRVCGLAVVVVLGAYVLGIGAPTSAVRAWWMVACGVAALVGLRRVSPFRLLAAAVYAMLLADPLAAGGIGFQLSVGATAAILLWIERPPGWLIDREIPGAEFEVDATNEPQIEQIMEMVKKWGRRAALGAGVSVVATLVTWPVLVSMTGELPVAGIWTNIIVTPVVSATVIPWMFVGTGVAWIAGGPGWWMLSVGASAVELLSGGLAVVAAGPGATWVTGVPAGAWTLVGVAGAFIVAAGRGRWRPLWVGGVLLATSLVAAPLQRSVSHSLLLQPLRVHAIPVGQGDATLVETPGGETILVDGGGRHYGSDPGRAIVVPYLKRRGIGALDWVVASHADTDHIGGLAAVVEELSPERAMFDGADRSPNLREWRQLLESAGVEKVPTTDVTQFKLGGADVRVLRPDPRRGSANDHSLYMTIGFAGRRVVLPGDIEKAAERWLARQGRLRRAAVIKVPHHGSKTSTSRQFVQELSPRAAIISAGADNPFGHPHPRVIRRLRAAGVDVWQTASSGLIRVNIDHRGRIVVSVTRSD